MAKKPRRRPQSVDVPPVHPHGPDIVGGSALDQANLIEARAAAHNQHQEFCKLQAQLRTKRKTRS